MTPREPSPPREVAIGIDVGGTKCAAGLVQLADGRILTRRLQATRPERGGAAVLADVVAVAKALLDEASALGVTVDAIGVGVAELVGLDCRVLSGATIAWERIAVDSELAHLTGRPVCLEADVRAAARAEAHFGAGRNFLTFLYVTVGTGISACLVIERVPFTGARGLTGTFASAPGLIPGADGKLVQGPPLEQYAAGPALAARLKAVRPAFQGSAFDVISLSDAGDDEGEAIVHSAGTALGAAIGHLVNVLDVEAVVIGGGLGLVEGQFRRAMDDAMREHIWSPLHRDSPLLSAQLGVDAGVVGAALAASQVSRRG